MTFTIHLQVIKELIDIAMQIAIEIAIEIEIRALCEGGTALIVDVSVWIRNSFDFYENIHLI